MDCLQGTLPTTRTKPTNRPAANAQDYQALLSRHQQAEAGLARAQEAAADMRARLEAITGPQGPQARLRQLEGQLAQVGGPGASAAVVL